MTDDDKEIVTALEKALASTIGPSRYDTWFGPTTRMALVDGRLRVSAVNAFYEQWLRRNFHDAIAKACRQVLARDVPIDFCIDAQPLVVAAVASEDCQNPQDQSNRPLLATLPAGGHRPYQRLEAFVVSETNRATMASVRWAATEPGRVSPLVLYGPTGVGKTHLLEGILMAARKRRPQTRALLVTGEQFTSHFVAAVHGRTMPSFRRKYRGVELLLIDDVHFLAGKAQTLGELLYTLDSLLAEGRQVVLSADRSPADLHVLGPEIKTRLEGGMTCRIEPPDHQARLGILRQLADRRGLSMSEDVLQFIAARLTAHARQLTGALNRLQATSEAFERPITLELAQEALAEMIQDNAPAVQLRDIDKAVCQVFGIDKDALHSGAKAKRISYPRMLAMWLARKHTRAAYSEIGRYFGQRSHSTVISAQHKVDGWLQQRLAIPGAERQLAIDEAVRRIEAKLQSA